MAYAELSNGCCVLRISTGLPSGARSDAERAVHLQDGVDGTLRAAGDVAGDVGHRLQVLVVDAGLVEPCSWAASSFADGDRRAPAEPDRRERVERRRAADRGRRRTIGTSSRAVGIVQQADRRAGARQPDERRNVGRRQARRPGLLRVDVEPPRRPRRFDVPVDVDDARRLLERLRT